jgi:hypothetical protein
MRNVGIAAGVLGLLVVVGIGAFAAGRLGREPRIEARDGTVEGRRVSRLPEPAPVRPMGRAGPPPAFDGDPGRPDGLPRREDGPSKPEVLPEPNDRDAGDEPDDLPTIFAIDSDGIQDGVKSQLEEIRGCYDTLLADHPDAAGRIVAAFTIGPDGRVLAADIDDSTVGSVYLEGCMVTAMEDLRFEPTKDGSEVQVTYPFDFSPEQ